MRFPAKKNAGCPKAPCDFPPRKDGILCPRRVVLGLPSPSPSHRVCGRTDVRSCDYYITTKISRIDRLPYFLSNGAPLAGFARRLRYYLLIFNNVFNTKNYFPLLHRITPNYCLKIISFWATTDRPAYPFVVSNLNILLYFTARQANS